MQSKFRKIQSIIQGTSFAYQVFQVFRHGAILLAAIVFTWLDPQKALITQFELLMLLGSSLTFFWVTGLLDGFLLIYKASSLENRGKVVFQALMAALFFAAICSISFIIVGASWSKLTIETSAITYFAVFIGLDSAGLLLAYLLMAEERRTELMVFASISAISYLLALLVPIALWHNLELALLFLMMLSIAKVIYMCFAAFRIPIQINFDKSIAKKILFVSAPLAAVALLSQSAILIDGFIVEHYFQNTFVDFRYGARELPFVLVLANSLSAVKSGEFAEAFSQNNSSELSISKELKKSSNRLIWMLFPLTLMLLFISGPLYELVFANRFAAAVPVFDVYLLLIIPRLLFPQALVRGLHKTHILTFSALVELVLNFGLSLLFLNWWGIAGIAAATVIAFCVEKAVLVLYLYIYHGQKWNTYSDLKIWIPWTIVILLAFAGKYLLFV